jgi:hypothetical protein
MTKIKSRVKNCYVSGIIHIIVIITDSVQLRSKFYHVRMRLSCAHIFIFTHLPACELKYKIAGGGVGFLFTVMRAAHNTVFQSHQHIHFHAVLFTFLRFALYGVSQKKCM